MCRLPRLLVPALALAVSLAPSCGGAPAKPRSVLLISIDSLRADHLSSAGYRSPTAPTIATTPKIDALLTARGARFTHATSTTSWTLPGHMAMLSGRPDELHGVRDLPDRLPPKPPPPPLSARSPPNN